MRAEIAKRLNKYLKRNKDNYNRALNADPDFKYKLKEFDDLELINLDQMLEDFESGENAYDDIYDKCQPNNYITYFEMLLNKEKKDQGGAF